MHQEQMFALFELLWGRDYNSAAAPTAGSISAINNKLGISLPTSFITFANSCPNYGSIFASIGDDYSNPNHINNLNTTFHHEAPEQNRGLPPWAMVINHGHDGCCNCLDTRKFCKDTGEYALIYCELPVWEPESAVTVVYEEITYKTFPLYLEYFVLERAERHIDNKNRSGRLRTESREIVAKIEAILNSGG